MNMTRKIAGLMFAIFGGAAILMGCPEPGSGESCVRDSDCTIEGDLCFETQCVEPCATDDDCFFGDKCLERPAGGGMVCQVDTDDSCVSDDDCAGDQTCNLDTNQCEGDAPQCTEQEDCDDGFFCDTNAGECIPEDGGLEYYTVRVHDVTTERCDDVTYGWITPGAKLQYVALIGSDGTYLSYGDAVDYNLGSSTAGEEPNFGFIPSILNGQPPSYSDRCPDTTEDQNRGEPDRLDDTISLTNFHEDAVAPLGCDGEVYVQFRDQSGNLIQIQDGMEIEVNEYGTFCAELLNTPVDEGGAGGNHEPQEGEDAYDVYICTDRSASSIDLNTCDRINSAPAFGLVGFPVTFQ